MCRCRAQPNALCPRVEISAVAVVVFALAWLEKNNNNYNNSIKKKGKTFKREIREGEACTSLGRCARGP